MRPPGKEAAMKAFPFRKTVLVIAVALGTGALPKAYACDGTESQTPQHALQDRFDQLAPQSDFMRLAKAFLLGLALLDEPYRVTSPCSGCAQSR
jgi:hypothetical protein